MKWDSEILNLMRGFVTAFREDCWKCIFMSSSRQCEDCWKPHYEFGVSLASRVSLLCLLCSFRLCSLCVGQVVHCRDLVQNPVESRGSYTFDWILYAVSTWTTGLSLSRFIAATTTEIMKLCTDLTFLKRNSGILLLSRFGISKHNAFILVWSWIIP